MTEAKFKLTEETINVNGEPLYRIEALKDFGDVRKRDKGGFIEKEENLSQNGDCWVYDNAQVRGNAMVCGDAKVYGNAKICDYAEVYGNAIVRNNAQVYDNAKVFGNAKVFDGAMVFEDAEVYDNVIISDNAVVCGYARVFGKAEVYGIAEVCDNAKVFGNAWVFGNAEICGKAEIANDLDYIVFKNWWSSGRYFTWTKNNNMWKVGCFYGTGEELIEKAYRDSEKSGREYERVVKYVESILKDNNADV